LEDIVRVEGLSVSLAGKAVLEGITFSARPGEMTGIIGPNGAGKTTLLRAILGLVPVLAGSLTVIGLPIARLKEVRPKIGYMPQRQSFERRLPLSAADVVVTGLLVPGTILRRLNDKNKLVSEALQCVGMEYYGRRPFQDLSGGEQQRILLARSLVRKPDLLLLDEPNTGLDFPAQQKFVELLQKLKAENGLTIILVSHDIISVASAADQLVCINRTMHIHGSPADVMRSPHLDEAYRCQFDFLSNGGDKERCWH